MIKKLLIALLVLLLSWGVIEGASALTGTVLPPWSTPPSWLEAGTYATYDINYTASQKAIWKWQIVSKYSMEGSDFVDVLHTFVGMPEVGGKVMPSTYLSTINASNRAITNVVPVDRPLPQGYSPPFPTIFALWIPSDVQINQSVSLMGPWFLSVYPPAPILRFENVETQLGIQECVLGGFGIENGYPETDYLWYNASSQMLVRYYMNWPSYQSESGAVLTEWAPMLKFSLTVDQKTYNITALSNSTISGLSFSQTSRQLSFSVDGASGTTGFCNITIPASLMSGTFSVFRDDVLLVNGLDYVQTFNGTHYTFTLNYSHSLHTIRIISSEAIPEFPSNVVMMFILVPLLVGILLPRKKLSKNQT